MRLLSRHAPVQELVNSAGDGPQADRFEVPLKAQKLLGEKPQLNYKVQELVSEKGDSTQDDSIPIPLKAQKLLGERVRSKHSRSNTLRHGDPDSLWNVRDAEQKSWGAIRSEADSDTIPGGKTGAPLPNVPVPMRSSEDLLRSSNDSTGRTGTSTQPAHQPSTESMDREYYDASKQPLYVSQQTSESSVRDMALHRGAPPISDTSSEAPLIAHPLRNVIPRRRATKDRTASDEPKRERKIDLMSLFPHPKTSAGVMSSGKVRSAGQAPNNLDFSPEKTVPVQVARQGSKLGLDKDYQSKPLPKHPSEANAGRAKVFESDVYDSKRTNVYRPPKGAKNWFDGFDISSDEEEPETEPEQEREPEPAELPPVELPANEIPRVMEALPSVFSLYGTPTREFTAPHRDSPEPELENTAPITRSSQEATRRRTQRLKSESSPAVEEPPFEVPEERKRSGESRLAHSRLGAESVLSLSDESGGPEERSSGARSMENDLAVLEKAASLEIQRPSAPVRKLSGLAIQPQFRRAHSAAQRSRSFQEKLIDDTTPPPLSRGKGSVLSNSSPAARWEFSRQRQSSGYSVPRRRRTNDSNERDRVGSAGGETNSSAPTDASRMMAVTEEEMMLLELMRQKRAAMQNDSFTEGYRLAQEERHHFTQDQSFTQDYRLSNVQTNDNTSARRCATSGDESLLREETEHRRQMSAIRKEEVDKAFKMGRFLAMENPNDNRQLKIDRFLNMAPGLSDEFQERPVSGTEIETESRYDELEETEEECESDSEDGEAEEKAKQSYENCVRYDLFDGEGSHTRLDEGEEHEDMRTPRQAQTFSPMQRLTEQVRELPAGDVQTNEECDIDRLKKPHHTLVTDHQEKTFHSGALPTPPIDDIREQTILYDSEGRELLSPKVYTPSIRSPTQTSKPPTPAPFHNDGERSSEPEASESQINGPESPVATTWARPSSLKHPQPQRQRPVLDFTPLESRPPPSVANSGPSPLTPTLEVVPRFPDETASEITSFDNASVPSERHSTASAVPQPLKSHPVSPGIDKKASKSGWNSKLSTFPQTQKVPGRITSMTSITSAGEDVLAAWAELGGGSDALAFRRKRNR